MAWTYQQLFNTLTDGDLNGQDSWSGDTGLDVATSTPVPWEGAKCLKGVTPADFNDHEVTRSITSLTSGVVYFSYLFSNASGSDKRAALLLYSGATKVVHLKCFGSQILMENNTPGNDTLFTGLVVDTWYRIGLEYDASTDQARANKDGGAWSSWVNVYAASSVDTIKLSVSDNNGIATGYIGIDAISPDYTPSAGGGANTTNFFAFMDRR